MNPEEHFIVDPDVYEVFRDAVARGKILEAQFEQKLQVYSQKYPDPTAEFKLRIEGNMVDDWRKYIPRREDFPKDKFQSRESASVIFAALAERLNTFKVGTADVRPSINMSWEGHVSFQHPNLETVCGLSGDYTGRYLHCGIREHAMTSIANGLTAFNPGTIIPVTSGFFLFYIYSAAGIRMGAIQGLQAIHLATHDSIAIGDDGPAHQPVELSALFQAYVVNGWERYADAGHSMNSFGKALPANTEIYKFFNFDTEVIAAKVQAFVDEVSVVGLEALRGNFRDLKGGRMGYGWNPL
ncbi:uncharacterized protein KY384_004382 [Bacidia gigantensis]|uniref:uncharacterized protein n=1 Tax=Bacidia gigantensis TaxID=2732470 RepID=UPI001D0443DE|nr:uncharacterized protein KY384_004382 [Bacidia gigantensis]KAG8531025.1 hypothetical protein KY384_004382 [Bacidia gigantensis]